MSYIAFSTTLKDQQYQGSKPYNVNTSQGVKIFFIESAV